MEHLAPDQQELYQELCTHLRAQKDEAHVIEFMDKILESLLRRRGDEEFLKSVEDILADGLHGRPWQEQQELARQVLALVITKRPEVARAWQKTQGKPPSDCRRR